MSSASRIYKCIFWIPNWEGMKLVDQALKLLVVILMVVVLESDSPGFDVQRQVIARTAALCLCTFRTRGRLLKEEVIVTGEYCSCDIEDVLEVESLSLRFVGVHGNKAFAEGLLVIRVESMPEDSVVLAYGYPTCAEEDLALSVELALVVDNVSLVSHALPGVLAGKVDKLLS